MVMGRPIGSKNVRTIAREEHAKAEIAAGLAKAKAAGRADPVNALDELYKCVAISQGFAAKLRPRDIQQDASGNVTIVGGDIAAFGQWFDRYFRCTVELAKYQLPPIKPMDAPTPPPTPEEVEAGSHQRFILRVFEGGKQVPPLRPLGEDDANEE